MPAIHDAIVTPSLPGEPPTTRAGKAPTESRTPAYASEARRGPHQKG